MAPAVHAPQNDKNLMSCLNLLANIKCINCGELEKKNFFLSGVLARAKFCCGHGFAFLIFKSRARSHMEKNRDVSKLPSAI